MSDPLRETRRVAHQQHMLRFRQRLQPLVKLSLGGFVDQRVSKLERGTTGEVQNNFRRLSGANQGAGVSRVKFDARAFQKTAHGKRFILSPWRKWSRRVVHSLQGISMAQKIQFHESPTDFKPVARASGFPIVVASASLPVPGPARFLSRRRNAIRIDNAPAGVIVL